MNTRCSAPTASAARRAAIRSIRRPCAASAPRSCARCRTATESPQLLIGRDTRESGTWIEAELAHGAVRRRRVGHQRRRRPDAGGRLPDARDGLRRRASSFPPRTTRSRTTASRCSPAEARSSPRRSSARSRRSSPTTRGTLGDGDAGAGAAAPIWSDAYLDHLRAVFPETRRFQGFRLAIDCANGATTTVAPGLFASLGFDVVVIGDQPDGRNINLDCGSTHPERLAARSSSAGAQWAWRSTATATARSSSTTAAGWSTATPCC